MSGEICLFHLVGCPPNWSNRRLHWAVLAREKDQWKRLAAFSARSAAHRRGWGLAKEDDPQRLVTITCYRVQEMDDDGNASSIKPVLDGIKGALVWDDAKRWCKLVTLQEKVGHRTDQRTLVAVEKPVP